MNTVLPVTTGDIGQAVTRVEDRRFVTGRGQYVDDITLPHRAYCYVVRSTFAHARILSRDVSEARLAPGVPCVLTGEDVLADKLSGFTASAMPEDFGAPPGHRTFRPVLATDKIRFPGEVRAVAVEQALEAGATHAEAALLESEEYKLYLARVLTRRVIEQADAAG